MTEMTIYGASDDLVEIEGDVSEEFSAHEVNGETCLGLFFSDGTILHVVYTDAGVWRITQHAKGSADYKKIEAPLDDEDNYSDRVTLRGEIEWILPSGVGTELVRIKAAS